MTERKDSATMDEIYNITAELISIYSKAHNRWCVLREASHGALGVAERCAMYVAMRSMLRALPIENVIDSDSIERLDRFAEAIEISTSPDVADADPSTAKDPGFVQ